MIIPTTSTLHINPTVRGCAREMLKKFDSQFGVFTSRVFTPSVERGDQNRQVGIHLAYVVAHAMDPHFKDSQFVENQESCDVLWKHVLDLMVLGKKKKAVVSNATENDAESKEENKTEVKRTSKVSKMNAFMN